MRADGYENDAPRATDRGISRRIIGALDHKSARPECRGKAARVIQPSCLLLAAASFRGAQATRSNEGAAGRI